MYKRLFITTSSLAANPRLVKELEYLKNYGQCTVLCFTHQDWSHPLSQNIIKANPEVPFICIDRKRSWLATLASKLVHKLAIGLNPFFKSNLTVAAYASNDKTPHLYWQLLKLLKTRKVHRVMAHNLGAFYPALKAAKRYQLQLQLDVEDFHPGENVYFNKKYEVDNRHLIMQYCLSQANAITYASEGIANICQHSYDLKPTTQQHIILNSFKQADFLPPKQDTSSEDIHCVWFSQNISSNRGLEQVFEAAKTHPNISFHLIGNPNKDYLNTFEMTRNLILHPIMPQKKLHGFLSKMDIGLALEPGKDANNNIALSNKMIAYAQAGLYILATSTEGQRKFLENLPYGAGALIETDLKTSLANLDRKVLRLDDKYNRWEQAKSLSWEVEQKKLHHLLF